MEPVNQSILISRFVDPDTEPVCPGMIEGMNGTENKLNKRICEKTDGNDKSLKNNKLGINCDSVSSDDKSSDNNWAGLDSNQRRLTPMGLQPIPFSHSGTDPCL
jgi:hypothetical protein